MVDKNLYFSRQIELMNKLTTAANNEDYIELYNALVYLYLGGYLNQALDEKNYNMNLGYAIDDKIFTDVNSLTSYAYTAHNDQFDGSVTSSYQLLRANASTNENYRPSQALQAILRANTSYELSEDAVAKSRIDGLYETIVLSGANSLQDIGKLKDDGKLLDFESILSDNPDLANIFAQYASEDEQGNFLAEDPGNLGYLLFMSELSKRGTSTLGANSMSSYSQAAMATNTLTQLLTGNEVNDASLSDLQQIVGSSVVSKYNLFGQAQANKINENIGFDSNGDFNYG